MLVTGMAIYGLDTNDDELVDFALAQPGIYQTHLQSTNGTYYHSYNVVSDDLMPTDNVPWLRGNGWVAANLVDMMEAISSSNNSDRYASRYHEYSRILHSVVSGLRRTQMSNGLWDTVVERPGYAYPETSGSALVGYTIAKGVNLGVLPGKDIKLAQNAFSGIAALLVPSGPFHALTETSVGTNPSKASGYRAIGRKSNVPYGVGAFAMLASELEKYERF